MVAKISNGQKWWFITPAIAIIGALIAYGACQGSTKAQVAANCAKNSEQDKIIQKNADKNVSQDIIQGRIEERLIAIQRSQQEMKEMLAR